MEIDHVAIVVKDLERTVRLYTQTLGFKEVYREVVSDQGIEAVGLLFSRAAAPPRRSFTDRPLSR
jgi:catechol 2,3-dioxygenase-like lactoylglutathione lyase family enzyme